MKAINRTKAAMVAGTVWDSVMLPKINMKINSQQQLTSHLIIQKWSQITIFIQ